MRPLALELSAFGPFAGVQRLDLRDVDEQALLLIHGATGSGKTSLVFDTLYHEARRRFLDIFSPGFSGLHLAPADVDRLDGVGPAVSVGQNLLNRNPASTVATASGLAISRWVGGFRSGRASVVRVRVEQCAVVCSDGYARSMLIDVLGPFALTID